MYTSYNHKQIQDFFFLQNVQVLYFTATYFHNEHNKDIFFKIVILYNNIGCGSQKKILSKIIILNQSLLILVYS